MDAWQAPASSWKTPEDPVRAELRDDVRGAGFGPRALARLVDLFVHLAISVGSGVVGAIALVVLQVAGAVAPGWENRGEEFSILGFVGGFVSSLLYHAVAESLHGATLGKLLLGLRVVAVDGGRASVGQGLVRAAAFTIDGLFFGFIGYSAMQSNPLAQRLGDQWAGTVVVHTADVPPATARSLATFAWVFPSAVAAAAVVQVIVIVLDVLMGA